MASYTGTSGDDSFTGTNENDVFDLSQGGSDTAVGRFASDFFQLGATLDRSDRLTGGGGADVLALDGDYSAGLALDAFTVTGMEQIRCAAGYSYDLTLHDGTVAAGALMAVIAQGQLRIDASAETDGRFNASLQAPGCAFIGGAGDDIVNAAAGAFSGESFHGGAGLDSLSLYEGGTTRFSDATLTGFEQITLYTEAYRLTLNDGACAPGQTLIIDAQSAAALALNGSREHDGRLVVSGTDAGDTLTGGRGDDTLLGGAGDDRVTGGRGGDVLFDSQGADTLVYADRKDSAPGAPDRIANLADDEIIDLSRIDADKDTPGDQAFVLVEAFSGAAGEAMLVYDEIGIVTHLLLETNGKGAADADIQLLDGDYTEFAGLVL